MGRYRVGEVQGGEVQGGELQGGEVQGGQWSGTGMQSREAASLKFLVLTKPLLVRDTSLLHILAVEVCLACRADQQLYLAGFIQWQQRVTGQVG